MSFLRTPFLEASPALSPNGRWIAYHSNESGERQVHVQSVPSGGFYQISIDGGRDAKWRSDGRELYYRAPDLALMAVDIEPAGNALDVGLTRTLFRVPFRPPNSLHRNAFDVTADGERFLVNAVVEGARAASITWAVNWAAGLEE